MPFVRIHVTLTLLWLNFTDCSVWAPSLVLAVCTSEPQPAFFVGVLDPPKWNMLCAT